MSNDKPTPDDKIASALIDQLMATTQPPKSRRQMWEGLIKPGNDPQAPKVIIGDGHGKTNELMRRMHQYDPLTRAHNDQMARMVTGGGMRHPEKNADAMHKMMKDSVRVPPGEKFEGYGLDDFRREKQETNERIDVLSRKLHAGKELRDWLGQPLRIERARSSVFHQVVEAVEAGDCVLPWNKPGDDSRGGMGGLGRCFRRRDPGVSRRARLGRRLRQRQGVR